MFTLSKLSFFALVAAASAVSVPSELVSRAEASVGRIGGLTPAAAQVALVIVCKDPNFVNCITLNFASVPTGCLTVPAAFNNEISSIIPLPGIVCTFFDNSNCTGRSVVVTGPIANLDNVGMNDLISSFSCVSA
ncbi:hypothetical protein C8J57DRAFT_1718235 [Mycena rebaudengoi]|nr:hypothetical protein C8J57DRAFT_1403130 [Mycena rebaudengoi]KAJ7265558.1 hypothetical protein C8J57DRAFT_1718235 [Mycena rebaudengoi]